MASYNKIEVNGLKTYGVYINGRKYILKHYGRKL